MNVSELQQEAKRLVADMVRLQESKAKMEREIEAENEKHKTDIAEKQDKINELEVEVMMLQEKYTASTRLVVYSNV